MTIPRHVVAEAEAGLRLDKLLCALAPGHSRGALQKAVRAGRCLVDGAPLTSPDARLRCGQSVEVRLPEARGDLRPEDAPVPVLWRDRHLLVCDKPAGLAVHPCPSRPEGTLVQRLLRQAPELARMGGQRPGIVHRLDKDTSGLLLVALTETDRLALSNAFAMRQVHKEYLALVAGRPPERGVCREPLGRDPASRVRMAVLPESRGGRPAHTEWRTLWNEQSGRVSLLAVRIRTGRTHQIRVHMAHLGHPLLGDTTYAPRAVRRMAPRQMLHAWRLAFTHPATGEALRFHCPPPPDILEAALAASRRPCRLVVTGNPGSGKSALTRALAEAGVPVCSADGVVAELYGPGGAAGPWLCRLGAGLVNQDGSVDKTALLAAMRASQETRREVERVVHALVRQRIERFWEEAEARGASLAAAEVPLYFETGWRLDPAPLVVGVRCPLETRLERVAASREWDAEKLAALEAWQWPEARKMDACHIVVDNAGGLDALRRQARSLPERLRRRQAEAEAALARRLEALIAEGAAEAPPA